MKNLVSASAPGKLMLLGEHSVVYGYPCIVSAVNQRILVTVGKNGVETFHLDAPDLGLKAYSKTIHDLGGGGLPKGVRFIEAFYKNFLEKFPQKEGIDVVTNSDFSDSYGFGSSSAVTVAFGKALTKLYGIELSNKELFKMCYQAVLDVQGVGSGFDVAAAVYGGTIYYVSPGKKIKSLKEENLPLVVGYTKIKADTPTLIRQVAELRRKEKGLVDATFKAIGILVDKAAEKIEKSEFDDLGKLMNQDQKLLEGLRISSFELDKLITAVELAGAKGAKLSGAGGGDCMVALVNDNDKKLKNKVKLAITKAGGEVIDVKVGADGVRLEGKR